MHQDQKPFSPSFTMLQHTWLPCRRLVTGITSTASSTGKCISKRASTHASKTEKSNLPCQFASSISAFKIISSIYHCRPQLVSSTLISKRFYSTPQTLVEPYEKEEKCLEDCNALLASLASPSVIYSVELERLRSFITAYPEAGSSSHVHTLIKAWTSSLNQNIDTASRVMALEVVLAYFCDVQHLSKAENVWYSARSRLGIKGSENLWTMLLQLSGRHKQRPSIELAFKSWKSDLGLTYTSTDLEDPSKSFFELLKDEKTAEIARNLFCATIRAASRAKLAELAMDIFQESLRVIHDNIVLYETMIEGFCFMNRVESAYELLFEFPGNLDTEGKKKTHGTYLKPTGTVIEGAPVPTTLALHTILDACARLKNFHLSERVFYDTKSSFHLIPSTDTWNLLFKVYVERKDMGNAHNRFLDMLKSTERTRPNLDTYELLIPGHVRADDVVRAEEMLKHAKSNNIEATAFMYAWVMEGFLHKKQYDEAFAVIEEMRGKGLALPHKFQNLLLRKCRRIAVLLPRYEAIFGPAPEETDDLVDVKLHVHLKRQVEETEKAKKKMEKQGAKTSESIIHPLGTENESLVHEELAENFGSASEDREELVESSPSENVHIVGSSEHEFGVLEELIEDDTEISKEEWMKDDIGENGWKELRGKLTKPKRSKRPTKVNARYQEVFEAVGWTNNEDVGGSIKVKEWQLLDDPFSQPKPETVKKNEAKRRATDQIESIQQEVLEKIDAQTARSKLKDQRRRERIYGNRSRLIIEERLESERRKVREDRAPAGSTFSFR